MVGLYWDVGRMTVERQKAEAKLNDVENQLQTEVSAHQAAVGNSQQSVEKVQQLEKQVLSDYCCVLDFE